MKHFYESIGENWFSYKVLYSAMVKRIPPGMGATFVEVGCWRGRSAAFLGVEMINSGKHIKLYCVDSWKYIPSTEQPVSSQEDFDKVKEEFYKNMEPFGDAVEILPMSSKDAVEKFEDESIDFAFIDAAHDYYNVYMDIKLWYPKVKKGGIIAGHDYFTSVHPDVKTAVDDYFRGKSLLMVPKENFWLNYK